MGDCEELFLRIGDVPVVVIHQPISCGNKRGRTLVPEPQTGEASLKIVGTRPRQGGGVRKAREKTFPQGSHARGSCLPKKHFGDKEGVGRGPGTAPREIPAVLAEPPNEEGSLDACHTWFWAEHI